MVNRGGGGVLPSNSSNRLMGMCHGMGSHFQGWVDYNRVTFSLELLRMGSHIFGTGESLNSIRYG